MRILLGVLAMSAGLAWASPFAYVTNVSSDDLSIIDTATGTVTATVPMGQIPNAVAVSPDGQRVYVVNSQDQTVWRLDGSGTFVNSGPVGIFANAVVYDAATDTVYVSNMFNGTVTILDGSTLAVQSTVSVGTTPVALTLNPGSSTYRVLVANYGDDTVSGISTAGVVSAPTAVGSGPNGIGVDRVHGTAYVANQLDDTVTYLDATSLTVLDTFTLPPGSSPSDVVVDHAGAHWYVAACCKVLGYLAGTDTPTLSANATDSAWGIDIDPSDTTLYVTDPGIDAVDVIPIASPASVTTIAVGSFPNMSGRFIGPGTPGAPTSVSATPGNGQAVVSFSPPAFDGGTPVLQYQATCGAQSSSGAGSPLTVAGLANGVTVACTVVAVNAMGAGTPSAPVNVTPGATVPDAPTGVTVLPGSGDVTVTFTAPASNGGSPVISYTVTCGTHSATGTSSPITVGGLANGVPVTCTVTATNTVGTSSASAPSAPATPAPKSFTGPVATGAGLATVTLFGGGAACNFAPQGNGVLQSAFFIPVVGSPKSPPAGTAPATFPFGLLDFVLLACNTGSTVTLSIQFPGTIPAGSVYWKYGPTPTQPTPHWYVLPATISGNTVTFSITDGGLGDDDLTANGTVVDQGGPGGGPARPAVPALDRAARAMLAVLLAACGVSLRRRGR
jgi:YVTN family beta-propeller protein